MTTAYQLPEDIGQKSVTRNGTEVQAASEFPAGQTTAAKSLPTVLPRENYTLPIIDNYRSATEVDRDLLGFPRATTPFNFLTKNDAYELNEDSWIYDVTGLNERPQLDSTQSARWTQILNATAVYAPAAALSRHSLALLFACFTCVHACCIVQSEVLPLHSYCFRLFCIGLSLSLSFSHFLSLAAGTDFQY